MDFKYIQLDKDDRIATIILNRPEKLNALNNAMLDDVHNALQYLERDKQTRVIIMRGEGKSWSTGYDLEESTDKDTLPEYNAKEHLDFRHSVMFTIWNLLKPVISQVHGYCLAGGSELAFMCDITIIAEDAIVGYPPVRTIGTPDTLYMPWLMGLKKAKLFLFTGDPITGKQAEEYGLATLAVPSNQLDEVTRSVAERVAKIPTELVNLNKKAINKTYEIMGFRAAVELGGQLHDLAFHTDTATEWRRIVAEEGLEAALKWRDNPFDDYGAKRQESCQ